MSEATLEVTDLVVSLDTPTGRIEPVGPVSFEVQPGEIVGLVGESGSGKTVTSLAIMGLLPRRHSAVGGRVRLCGEDLTRMSPKQLNKIRGSRLTMIFQEPMSALNPSIKTGEHVAEILRVHARVSRAEARARAVELLGKVGIPDPERRAGQYPHMFSGGMRQRIMIAMALACSPALLIADEPTTALDVTVQAEILQLLRSVQADAGMAMLYITHDLDVVAELCSRVMVMYAGQIVESGLVAEVFDNPKHPYTSSLLRSRELDTRDAEAILPGAPPSPSAFPVGCRFHPRCSHSVDGLCTEKPIELLSNGDRSVRCVLQEAR